MDLYSIVKVAHILSAAVLFGTGIGIAYFMLTGIVSPASEVRRFAARMTVKADFIFTLPAVVIQPATGVWLLVRGGFDAGDRWLVVTYVLYLIAGTCWLPVVAIQIRMRAMIDRETQGQAIDERAFRRLFRWWFALGWPAFGGVVVIYFLMVMKPSW